MTYISWVGLYEGSTDRAYLEVLLPRLMLELVANRGTRTVTIPPAPALGLRGRNVVEIAAEICSNTDAFHMLFVHGDTGGRNLERNIDDRVTAYCVACNQRCNWPLERCVSVVPRHEIEAWALSDPEAVLSALGVVGSASDFGLPRNAAEAERLVDPKGALDAAIRRVRGRRGGDNASGLLTSIAQTQSFAALRESRSFSETEAKVIAALKTLGALPAR